MNVHELTLQNYTAASGCPSACQPILYLGTAGSYGNEQINVVLGEGWQGLTVKAVFQPSGVPVVVPDGGGVISVPWEATQSVIAYPKGRISFQGYSSGRLVNTSDVFYAVGGSSAGTDNTPAPTPDEFQQFVDAVKSDADRAAQAAADAEAAVQKVTNAGTQAVTDIGNAKDSALEAIDAAREEAASSISADVEGAKQAAADAEQSAADAEQSAKNAADALANVQAAGKSALDDIATERQNTLSDIQNEGAKQQSAVAGAGTAALEAIGQTEQAAINQIKQTGATQVGAVQSAGTTQVGLVNSAGQQQAENIAQAGSQQVQAVQTAGTAAVGTVNDARDEAVEEIEAANAHSPQINQDTGYWQTWNAETGEYVDTTTKAQGPQGETGATPQLTIGTVTTLDPGEDATVTITGTAEAPVLNFGIPKGEQGDGSTSGSDLPATTAADSGKVPTVNAAGTGYELAGPYAPLSAAIRPTASGNPVNIIDSVEWPLLGLKVYGKSTQDGTPSPENPVPIVSAGDDGNVDVSVTGKNLLDISKMQQKSANGITFSLENGGLKINGTATANTDSPIFTFRLPAGTYISNISRTQFPWLSSVNYAVEEKGGSVRWLDADVAFTVLAEDIGKYFYFAVAKGKTVNEIIYPQLELGSVSTDYEPYTSQSLTISTPNGLPGIPVTSGGNYTIDGQQYRGNIRDYGAEVDTIAVEQIDSYNSEDVGDVWMSSTGQLTTGAQVVYALDTPTTQAIPATEMAAYRALHTYDGATVVSTAEDVAGLEVRYVANAQKYIDDRLAAAESHIQEIAAAQLNAQTGG